MKIKMYIENDNGVKNKIELDNVHLGDGIDLNSQVHKIIDLVANYKNEWIDPKEIPPKVDNQFYLILYKKEDSVKGVVSFFDIYSLRDKTTCFYSNLENSSISSDCIVGYFPLNDILLAAQKKFMFRLDDYLF